MNRMHIASYVGIFSTRFLINLQLSNNNIKEIHNHAFTLVKQCYRTPTQTNKHTDMIKQTNKQTHTHTFAE